MKIIVTRHNEFVDFLKEKNIIDSSEGIKIVSQATYKDIKDNDVIGFLPLRLAHLANTYTEIDFRIPKEFRGIELELDQLKEFYIGCNRYSISKIEGICL